MGQNKPVGSVTFQWANPCQDVNIKTHRILRQYKSVLSISWKRGSAELLFWPSSTAMSALETNTGRKMCTVRECRFW